MLHVWNITYISPKFTVKMVGKYTIYTHGASIWVPKSHKIHRPFRVEIARLVSAPLMGQSHFGDGFFKGFHEQPGGRWDPKKLPEILGVEESFKIRRSVSEIQREKLWVLIKSWPGDVWFNKNNPKTHTHTHWLTVPSYPSSSFLCRIFIHCFPFPSQNKKNCRQKEQNLPMIFRFFSGSSTPASVKSTVEKLPFGLYRIGSETIPGVWGHLGGFKTIYGCYMLLQVLIHHVI